MSFLYATRTISLPVRPSGSDIIDADGQFLARVRGYFEADALCQLVNAGQAIVKASEDEYDTQQDKIRAAFLRSTTLA